MADPSERISQLKIDRSENDTGGAQLAAAR